MLRTLLQHKVIVGVVGLVAAAALWYGLSQSSAPTPTIVASGAVGETAAAVPGTSSPIDKDTQVILETLLALRSVKLDGAIFSSPAFQSLKDFSTQIIAEPAGRPDPFAPLSAGAAVVNAPVASPSTNTKGR